MSISSAVASISSAVSSIATGGPQPPASQKAGDRPITFGLVDASLPSSQIVTLDMVIRPEELTRTDVSRATVQQTLGGGWVDDFGPGLATINISGTTGWRMNAAAQGNTAIEGVDQFAKLKTQTFTGWHKRRNDAVKAGKDPKLVTLFFVDTLDSTMDSVAPMNFTLRRSKSRPLLMQFNISMLVLSGTVYTTAPKSAASSNPLASLLSSIQNIVNGIKNVVNVVNGIVGQVTAYMQTATSLFQSVSNLITSAQAIPQSVLGAAKAMAQAGATMFSTIAAIPGNSTTQSAAAMSSASDFSNIWCLLNNAVNTQQTYPDYTPLYGASNCSSTNGGSPVSPYAGTNPFYAIVGAPQNAPAPTTSPATAPIIAVPTVTLPVVTMSPAAQQSLALINNSDPVLAPMSPSSLGVAAGNIAAGVTLQ